MEVLLVLLGIVIGTIGMLIYMAIVSVGTLRIDQSDPTEAPYLFLELDKSVESFMAKKHVLFRISKKNFISQD